MRLNCYSGVSLSAGVLSQNLQTVVSCQSGLLCADISSQIIGNISGVEISGKKIQFVLQITVNWSIFSG